MSVTQKCHYVNPFQGKPSPIHLPGLFLFSPEVHMKLLGHPIRAAFANMGEESLYKRIRGARGDVPPPQKLIDDLSKLFPESPLTTILEEVMSGDVIAQERIEMGDWELFLYDAFLKNGAAMSAHYSFILEIERACKEPLRALLEHQYADAASMLSSHPLMHRFMSEEVLSVLSSASSVKQLPPLQFSVALEMQLSLVALVDVSRTLKTNDNSISFFSCLLPTVQSLPKNRKKLPNPTSQFYAWLSEKVGAQSIENLFGDTLLDEDAASVATLKRWSAGTHQPQEALIRKVAIQLFRDENYEPLWNMYWGSVFLNFIGYYAKLLQERARTLENTQLSGALAPWPKLPFGYDSVESWLNARYPVWLDFHRYRLTSKENGKAV